MREHWKTSQQQYKGKSTTNYSATTPPLLGWSLHRISPLYIILKKLPETFFSSYKRKNVFELKLKKIGSLLKHPPILQVMSSRAFQDISASLVSFHLRNKKMKRKGRHLVHNIMTSAWFLQVASAIFDMIPIFLVFQPNSTRSRIQPKRFYPTLLNHHSRLMVLCIN